MNKRREIPAVSVDRGLLRVLSKPSHRALALSEVMKMFPIESVKGVFHR